VSRAELHRELDTFGRQLRKAGAFDLLEQRLAAPVDRARAALSVLERAAAADRSTWLWLVWPAPVQVLRQAACQVGLQELEAHQQRLEAGRERLAAWQTAPDADARLGAVVAGVPELVDELDVTTSQLNLVRKAQDLAQRARSRLVPRHRRRDAFA
jgi:hypothetical protein